MAKRYPKVKNGEWVQPISRGYRMACCDCGLIHQMNFRIVRYGKRQSIQFQAERHNRATATYRRRNGIRAKYYD